MSQLMTAADRLRSRLRDYLDMPGRTQRQLAEQMGVSEGTLSEKLQGRPDAARGRKQREAPTPFMVAELDVIADCYGVEVSELIRRDTDTQWPLREDEARLITHYRSLPREYRDAVMAMLDYIMPLNVREAESRAALRDLRRLPMADRERALRALRLVWQEYRARTPRPTTAEQLAEEATPPGTTAQVRTRRPRSR